MITIPENRIKNGISEGCFQAIIAKAGLCGQKIPNEDDYGVDYFIRTLVKINGKLSAGAIVLEVQLKSTVKWEAKENNILYRLRVKNYNNMVHRNISKSTPIILLLMCLDRNQNDWCSITESNIVFQKSIYWHKFNESVISSLDPDSSILISIPTSQLLTADALKELVTSHSPIL